MSCMQGWGEVVDDLMPHYDMDTVTLPPDFAREVDTFAASARSKTEAMVRLLRLFQDRIRSVGIKIGPGAFIPRAPNTVLSRGFGDCKDKSVLLAAALRHVGIDAAPALVSLKRVNSLRYQGPLPDAFDHMIVEVRLDGQSFWLDPTDTYQGGNGARVVQVDYRKALPLRTGEADVVEMHPPQPKLPTLMLIETIDFDGPDGSVLLSVQTIRKYLSADQTPRDLAVQSLASIGRKYLNTMRTTIPGSVGPKQLRLRTIATQIGSSYEGAMFSAPSTSRRTI